MKASVEEVNTVQRRVRVEVTADQVDKAFDSQFMDLRKKVRLKGFRPGKAPLKLLRKMYGASVASEVLQSLIKDSLFDAISENKINPIATPVLESSDLPEQGKEYAFSALIDVMPAIQIDSYDGVAVTCEVMNVDDKTVDQEIEHLRKHHAKRKTIDEAGAKAAPGQIVTIDQKAELDGDELTPFALADAAFELGNGQLLPEIDKALKGMTTGQSKDVTAKIPEDFPEESIAGKKVQFNISLKGLADQLLPNLDDEFAKDLGLESLEELKTQMRSRLEQESEQSKRQQIEQGITTQLINKYPFEVPPSMVDQVIDGMIGELKWQDQAEQDRAKQDPEFRKRFLEPAKRRAQNTLILLEVARKEELQVSDEDISEHVGKMMQITGEATEEQLKLQEQIKQQMAPQLKEQMLFEKTMNFLTDKATITEIPAKR